MNKTEREQLEALITRLMSSQPVTYEDRVAAVKFLREFQYLAARVAGEWQVARQMEADYGIR